MLDRLFKKKKIYCVSWKWDNLSAYALNQTIIRATDAADAWRKLKNELLRITVGGTPVIAVTEIYNGHAVSVNPKIYYKGNNPKSFARATSEL